MKIIKIIILDKKKIYINNMDNIIITAVGDISVSRDIKKFVKTCKNNNYSELFKYVKKYLEKSDLSLGNLETMISNNGSRLYHRGGPAFRADVESIDALINSGINTFNISNNHSNDFGTEAIKDTINILDKNNLNVIGKNNTPYKIFNIKNCKIGVIGLSLPFNRLKDNKSVYVYDYNNTLKLIRKIKEDVDILICSVHWGTEYKFKNNKIQKEIGKKLIKEGVDIILGHHPHVIQNKEIIKINNRKGYIFYSLGNFLFDSHYKRSGVRNTLILKIIIDKNKKIKFKYLPCTIYPKKGFIPIPDNKKFTKKYPVSNTVKADLLYEDVHKYLNNCKQKGGKNNNYNKNLIYCIFFILIILFCFKI